MCLFVCVFVCVCLCVGRGGCKGSAIDHVNAPARKWRVRALRFGRAAVHFVLNKVGLTPQRPNDTNIVHSFSVVVFCLNL